MNRQSKGVLVILLALGMVCGLAACGGEEAFYDADSTADCLPGDEFDPDEQVCYVGEATDGVVAASSEWWADYAESPEDCYEDEVYDPVDQLCYLADGASADASAEYGSLFDDILATFWGDEQDYADMEELGENVIITYEVNGNTIGSPQETAVTSDLRPYQTDTATHEAIWIYFASLIPVEQRTYVSKYAIFTDGPENVYAAVTQDGDNPNSWVLAIDIVDATDQQELTYSLIHEFGHLLTLNDSQVNLDPTLFYQQDDEALYNEAYAACPTYFPGEGCSRPDSYINLFYDRFWADLEDEVWELEAIDDEGEYEEAVFAFYERHADQFVTDYAATNVGEDIAESWTAFVLQSRPTGRSIAEQKVLFFYEFPELVRLRSEISARTFSRLRQR
ncbi:MAG: hypothetical protein IPM39_08500 [Chloroflexi bacterium]|nr:hypothetical protein [Chloroflexota bacterium]